MLKILPWGASTLRRKAQVLQKHSSSPCDVTCVALSLNLTSRVFFYFPKVQALALPASSAWNTLSSGSLRFWVNVTSSMKPRPRYVCYVLLLHLKDQIGLSDHVCISCILCSPCHPLIELAMGDVSRRSATVLPSEARVGRWGGFFLHLRPARGTGWRRGVFLYFCSLLLKNTQVQFLKSVHGVLAHPPAGRWGLTFSDA